MDQQIISRRSILFIGLCVGLYISFYTLGDLLHNRDSISVCNESTGLSVVIKTSQKEYFVVSKASIKDILSCIGKNVPFYRRKLDNVSVDSEFKYQAIRERYQVGNERSSHYLEELSDIKDNFLIINSNRKVLVILRSTVSPHLIQKIIRQHEIEKVYMPANSAYMPEIMQKVTTGMDVELYTLKKGENTGSILF